MRAHSLLDRPIHLRHGFPHRVHLRHRGVPATAGDAGRTVPLLGPRVETGVRHGSQQVSSMHMVLHKGLYFLSKRSGYSSGKQMAVS